MITHRVWMLQLGISILLNVSAVSSGIHYHRYMLSDYRKQHTHRNQQDYRPLPRPKYPKTEQELSKNAEPIISIYGTDAKTRLQDFLVRLYQGTKYLCMGTLITKQIVLTAGSCFRNIEPDKGLFVKTSDNKIHPLHDRIDEALQIFENGTIELLSLKEPLAKRHNVTASLCSSPLHPDMMVELPTYIRSNHKIRNQITYVRDIYNCRSKLTNDPNDENILILTDSMLCVENKKRTSICQETFGAPLIHDGEICGVNMFGHNCPDYYSYDTYAGVFNKVDFIKNKLEVIKRLQMHQAVN